MPLVTVRANLGGSLESGSSPLFMTGEAFDLHVLDMELVRKLTEIGREGPGKKRAVARLTLDSLIPVMAGRATFRAEKKVS